MKVLMCASEVYPFAKTGGLADVVGALPAVLGDEGLEVKVFMPWYKGMRVNKKVNDEWGVIPVQKNVEVICIRNDNYFFRDGLYGTREGDWPDNLDRFSFFSRKVLDVAQRLKFKPDVVHAHDWQAALIPVYLKTIYKDGFYAKTKSILTIHNLAYQGVFSKEQFGRIGIDQQYFSTEYFEFYDKVNILKAGIVFADSVTTVSPAYSRQIQTKEYGCGLEGVLQQKKNRLRGILNGIDYGVWNPKSDAFLASPYEPSTLHNKKENKFALQKELKLEQSNSVPLIGIVTRLAQQKGVDILIEAIPSFIKEYQLVVLGAGDKKYEDKMLALGKANAKNMVVQLKFDERLAHRIYAGSDFFLMPSQFEPCGLSQLISFKYGTVPIVHHTGGLADTVTDYLEDPKKGNGFVMYQYSAPELVRAVKRAGFVFALPEWGALVKRVMKLNFSWKNAAKDYRRLYNEC